MVPLAPLPQPVVVEGDLLQVEADGPEIVEVGSTLAMPVDEFDSKFEGPICAGHKIAFFNAQRRIQMLDLRDGRFADADRGDLV